MRKATNFEQHDHFKMNIGHLAPHNRHIVETLKEVIESDSDKANPGDNRREFGAKTRTITNALAYHPLGALIDEVMRLVDVKNTKNKPEDSTKGKADNSNADWHYLLDKLGLAKNTRAKKTIKEAAISKSEDERNQILKHMQDSYPGCLSTIRFKEICAEVNQTEQLEPLNPESSVDLVLEGGASGADQQLSTDQDHE
ncbi:hypothetical protein IDG82_10050 [Vibrio cholerae]|nr:hypothetical protein [Vibrio cholerae]MBD1197488.1 hypothetical protein [Vibrio cholerae]